MRNTDSKLEDEKLYLAVLRRMLKFKKASMD
jgi:hypothetical protein